MDNHSGSISIEFIEDKESLGTKFQLKLTILNFEANLPKKGVSNLKQKK